MVRVWGFPTLSCEPKLLIAYLYYNKHAILMDNKDTLRLEIVIFQLNKTDILLN